MREPRIAPSATSSWEELTLAEVIKRLRAGKFAVPNFQRAFVWNADLIKALMRSIFRDYYIGSLLLWQGMEDEDGGGTFDRLHCEPMYGFSGQENERNYRANREWIILGGQQRLSAMYYAFFAPEVGIVRDEEFRDRPVRFYLRIDKFTTSEGSVLEDEETFEVGIAVPESEEVDGHLFPLRLLSEDPAERSDWFLRHRERWQASWDRYKGEADRNAADDEAYYRTEALASEAERHVKQSRAFQNHLDSVLDYRVRYVELEHDLDVDRVRDIFTQVNKRGEQLDDFGLLNAVVTLNGFSPKMEISNLTERQLLGYEPDKVEKFVPRLMMLRAHPAHEIVLPINEYLTPGRAARIEERTENGEERRVVSRVLIERDQDGGSQDFRNRWTEAVSELIDGLTALRTGEQWGVPPVHHAQPQALIFGAFDAMVPVFCALWRDASNSTVAADATAPATKILQWYWASILMRRYGRTTEQDRLAANTDYREVIEWLTRASSARDSKKPGVVGDFLREADPEFLDRAQYRGMIDGDSTLRQGLISLMYSNAPRDLLSGIWDRNTTCEEHYIFPPEWCEAKGLEQREYETIFNRILVSRAVADLCCAIDGRSPMNFKVLMDRWGNRGEEWEDEKKDDVLASHFIAPDLVRTLRRNPKSLPAAEVRHFWHYRGREILATIGKRIFNEQRLFLLSTDRRWDRDIGRIEKALRRVCVDLIILDASIDHEQVWYKLDHKFREDLLTATGLSHPSALGTVEAQRDFRPKLAGHLETKVGLYELWSLIADAGSEGQWRQVKQLFPKGLDEGALVVQREMTRGDFVARMKDVTKLRNVIHHYHEDRLDVNTRNACEAAVSRMQVCLGLRHSGNRAAGI